MVRCSLPWFWSYLCRSNDRQLSCNCRPKGQCKQLGRFLEQTWEASVGSPCHPPTFETQSIATWTDKRRPMMSRWLAGRRSSGRCFFSRKETVALFVQWFDLVYIHPVGKLWYLGIWVFKSVDITLDCFFGTLRELLMSSSWLGWRPSLRGNYLLQEWPKCHHFNFLTANLRK